MDRARTSFISLVAVAAAAVTLGAGACSGKKSTGAAPTGETAPTTTPPAPSPGAATSGDRAGLPSSIGTVSETDFKAMHQLRGDAPPALHGTTIDLAGGKAYLSLPAGAGPFPGIVVIHEWWGLNDHIRHWADRLAADGYAAVAVDLYGGQVASNPDDAMRFMKAVDKDAAARTLSAALELLRSDPRVAAPKRAVIGWCFGGGWSLQTALAHPELDAAVVYYGQLETDPARLKAIKAPLLGVFATKDKGITPAAVDQFEQALGTAGVPATILRYDAEHAFANPSGPRYDEASAADAWTKVSAFLAQRLR